MTVFRNSVVYITALGLALSAQQPPAQTGNNVGTNGDSVTTFKSNVSVVIETVIVRDKAGKIIPNLTAKDFTVTEDGAPQTIQFCDYQTLSDAPDLEFAKRPDANPEPADDKDAKAVAPKVAPITNNQIVNEAPGDIRYKNKRLLAMYFDMSAMPVPDQLRAFAAGLKFIKTKMTSSDLMAIMQYTGGSVKVLNDFTDDRDSLQKTIQTMAVGEGGFWPGRCRVQYFQYRPADGRHSNRGQDAGKPEREEGADLFRQRHAAERHQ